MNINIPIARVTRALGLAQQLQPDALRFVLLLPRQLPLPSKLRHHALRLLRLCEQLGLLGLKVAGVGRRTHVRVR